MSLSDVFNPILISAYASDAEDELKESSRWKAGEMWVPWRHSVHGVVVVPKAFPTKADCDNFIFHQTTLGAEGHRSAEFSTLPPHFARQKPQLLEEERRREIISVVAQRFLRNQ